MKFFNSNEEENDLFTAPDLPAQPKPVKMPKLTPENPEYWDKEEGMWDHLRVTPRMKRLLWLSGAVIFFVGAFWILIGLFNPYIDEASQYGYIDTVERHGSLIKTYECSLIPYKSLADTVAPFQGDFKFSASRKLGKEIKEYRHTGTPVKIEYKVYKSAMPWRGESRVVAVSIDSVSTDSIVPPFGKKAE